MTRYSRWFRRWRRRGRRDLEWVPQVGEVVCDCRFRHQIVVEINLEEGLALLADGHRYSILHCLDRVPHEEGYEHPVGFPISTAEGCDAESGGWE